jgi:hypothetical protein
MLILVRPEPPAAAWQRRGARLCAVFIFSHRADLGWARRAGTIDGKSLLSCLIRLHAPAEVFGAPLVRTVVNAKWQEFAGGQLRRQGWLFLAHFLVFLAWQVSRPTSRPAELSCC